MRIHHIAIWTFRLEEMKEFYVRYFKGTSNEKYVNPKKGFESYFIRFDCGADLELTEKLRSAGYTISGEPRTSGDGYFESVVLDPDGNRVECVFKAG